MEKRKLKTKPRQNRKLFRMAAPNSVQSITLPEKKNNEPVMKTLVSQGFEIVGAGDGNAFE